MANRFRKAVAAAVVGYSLVFIFIYYYAWATSISQNVDWDAVLTMALWFATLGAMAGAVIAEMLVSERSDE